MDVIEAMETCSAVRELKPDPVAQELLERVIYAATRAPSPGNSQGWDFIVVRDRGLKEKIRDLIATRFESMRAAMPAPTKESQRRMVASALHLVQSLAEVPALIFVCGPVCYPPNAPVEQFVWSALYPAAQNILVAARSWVWVRHSPPFTCSQRPKSGSVGHSVEVKFAALIPIGWPERGSQVARRSTR